MTFLARASAGLTLWAVGFCLLYALHGLGCARGWNSMSLAGGTLFVWMLGSVWFLLCCGGIGVLWWSWNRLAGFERRLACASAFAGLAGTAITGAPIVLISACL